MQQKKTDPVEIPEDLPDITDKQQEFVRQLLEGKSASDAYRAAYSVENMSNEAIWVEASRVKNDPKVSLWLTKAKIGSFTRMTHTVETINERLEHLSHAAEVAGNYGAAVNATQAQAKLYGLMVDKVEDVTKPDTTIDDKLAAILNEQPTEQDETRH